MRSVDLGTAELRTWKKWEDIGNISIRDKVLLLILLIIVDHIKVKIY